MAFAMINELELKNQLKYNHETGIFKWIVSNSNRVKVGQEAGYLGPDGYKYIRINNILFRAHRLAWLYVNGSMPSIFIDHINGNRSDNRISNLRLATHSQNLLNTNKKSHNTSGYKGVSFYKGKWVAECRSNHVRKYLGRFETAEEASIAYINYAKENHKEFYRNQ